MGRVIRTHGRTDGLIPSELYRRQATYENIYNKISMPLLGWLARWRAHFSRGPPSRCRFIDIRLFQVRSYCSFTAMPSFLLQFYGYTITLAAV